MIPEPIEPVLINDPRVLTVPIEECGESLVDLRDFPVAATTEHPRASSPADKRLHCREGVAERLMKADRALPENIGLLVLECHRPLKLQKQYWETDLAGLRDKHPDWAEERLVEENAKFVAPPWIIPPHSTGGAVDLVLVDSKGQEIDMGSPLNEAGPLMHTAAKGISPEAANNRRILLEAMGSAGFVNYSYEWWHYSFGDRYWALITEAPAALYGAA